ncbi:MAG: hypothetical protein RBS80_27815 [Thermoguttaceae bacterium]|jgi:hypothetical protein|nr:hypothetical protein [Thermoguttaceae bacterium]
MSEEKKTSEDQSQPEIEEVVTDFGDVRVRQDSRSKRSNTASSK